ncbi:MAG: redoxin domain-containing protein [Burkholderiales bacterium]|nr:redoxin domain-containing protein [Burkholderiales bacterium]
MNRLHCKRLMIALALSVIPMLPGGLAHALKVGDQAPAFSLPATIGKQASPKDFPGKTLVLFFYTGAFTNT